VFARSTSNEACSSVTIAFDAKSPHQMICITF
jgi:hypothetical protein